MRTRSGRFFAWPSPAGSDWPVCPAAANHGQAAAPPEQILPDSTVFFVKVNNVDALREAFRQSQFGQLWTDPALKDFRDDLAAKLEGREQDRSRRRSASPSSELLELPQGPPRDRRRSARTIPSSRSPLAIIADAGKNAAKMTDVLTKATKQAEEAGAKVATETFKGLTLHVIQPPAPKEKKEGRRQAGRPPPAARLDQRRQPSSTSAATSSVVKDLIAHADGRSTTRWPTSRRSPRRQTKLGADAQVVWFLDIAKVIKLVTKASAKGGEAPGRSRSRS